MNASSVCTNATTAGIQSWNASADSQMATGPFYGAATELAAMALGTIQNFATGTKSAGGAKVVDPTGSTGRVLTMANSVSPAGNMGSMTCLPDYYGAAKAVKTATIANESGVNWADGGVFYVNSGPFVLNTHTLPANRQSVTIVVNGDIYINGDINYATSTSAATIPRFTLINRGNIYIDNDVANLHGAYISQALESDPTKGGTVETCAVINMSSGVPVADLSHLYNDCNKQRLTISGALSAVKLQLARSWGSLNQARIGDGAAEVFQYTPELWMADPLAGGVDSTWVPTYDSVADKLLKNNSTNNGLITANANWIKNHEKYTG
jgi:hypothetical protein